MSMKIRVQMMEIKDGKHFENFNLRVAFLGN
jgi:hypothetical protein